VGEQEIGTEVTDSGVRSARTFRNPARSWTAPALWRFVRAEKRQRTAALQDTVARPDKALEIS